jgi:two-component system osmolarity sensor histidine kinase EnvZ
VPPRVKRRTRLRPRTLFGRMFLTVAMVSALFQVFTLAVFGTFLLFPLGKRAAEDLVSVMIDAAQVWHQAEDKHAVAQMLRERDLHVAPQDLQVTQPALSLPYIEFLSAALSRQLHGKGALWVSLTPDDETWYWADIPVDTATVRLGFPRSRVAVRPPEALVLELAVGLIVTVAMVIVLVHRLTHPLERLSHAVRRMGRGPWPKPVPEEGPEELAELARSFNHMSRQVQELLANRTTLLAGVSHDLRTPLARVALALEMIPRSAAPELIAGIERDLEGMEQLLGLFLDVSRGIAGAASEEVDLRDLLQGLVDDARRSGATVRLGAVPSLPAELAAMPLHRVLCNLIENAVRYSEPAAVDLELAHRAKTIDIRILDRGPGVPEDQREQVFRPFYRLERSRNHRTGGSGLGLAIAQQLAVANGWQVVLHPREGGGTCAVVSLPVGCLRVNAEV